MEMKQTQVKFNKKLSWHYCFWLNGVRYLHGRMFSKEQAQNLKNITKTTGMRKYRKKKKLTT